MKNFKNLFLTALAIFSLAISGCLHIIEDVTFASNGSGKYKMTLDMSEMKNMMEMMKTMVPDSLAKMAKDSAASKAGAGGAGMPDNSMTQMGQQLVTVSASLKSIEGITNVVETNDTTAFKFGYTFDFANIAALNRALKVINKDKYDNKTDEIFKYSGKEFERLNVGDIGSELKKAMAENGGGGEDQDGGGNLDMIKQFFGEMSYKTVYHFPDRAIKKNSNDLGELTDDNHTLTITLKPFDEEQQKKKANIGTKLKLK
jgi:hypothetical protein